MEKRWPRDLLHRLADRMDDYRALDYVTGRVDGRGRPLIRRSRRGSRQEWLATDWLELGEPARRRIARRAVAIGAIVGIAVKIFISLETFALILLAFNGGRLSLHTGLEHPAFGDILIAAVVGNAVSVIVAMLLLRPDLEWFARGDDADAARRRSIRMLPARQLGADALGWAVSFGIYALIADVPRIFLVVVGGAFLLATVTSGSLLYLFFESAARPLAVMAARGVSEPTVVHGVRERMLVVWTVSSAVPMFGLLALNIGRGLGWLEPSSGTVDWASIVLAAIALSSGLRVVMLVGRAIADPLTEMREVVEAAADGDFDERVAVYDSSELGVLQAGLNNMLDGLAEREKIREIFSHHVGDRVAALALEHDGAMVGTNADVAMIFVDITGSTAFAAQRDPGETAVVLNAFFTLVADVVERHDGLINKFEGDAALIVFGAPTELDDPAAAALASARELAEVLGQKLPLKWGMGVAYGRVFAGNIGAQQRYEYTVIGDPVNESARLSDVAKDGSSPVVASGDVIAASDDDEAARWRAVDRVKLRGRAKATEIYVPVDLKSPEPPTLGSVLAELVKLPLRRTLDAPGRAR
ncbi:MAG: adenylate/guanylate cyclase domain-containing protein [Gordonia sp. (in: high G+C Gram-positive bacteria)]